MSELPDKNLFMVCRALNPLAAAALPAGFAFTLCTPDDLPEWYAFPFDTQEDALRHMPYMKAYYERVYAPHGDLFFERCLFVLSPDGRKIGTCFLWPAYGRVTTLHWLKVKKDHEGMGIGRALIARTMQQAVSRDYPVYLHTQPESFRAIGLYADFGFALLTDPFIGPRKNDLEECLPWLRQHMGRHFEKLTYDRAGSDLLTSAAQSGDSEF